MGATSLVGLAIQTPGIPGVLWWGPPGVGKSARIRGLADRLGWPVEVVIASIREPADFGGLPVPAKDGVRLEPPAWARRLAEARGPALLFLDEINQAPPAVQAALQAVVLDRRVGDMQLPDAVKVVAAANPPSDTAGAWDIGHALGNRFVHVVDDGVDVEAWTRWLTTGASEVDDVPVVAEEAWAREWDAARALVAAYIRRQPGALQEASGRVVGRFPPAFATPRSWEFAARLVATCRAAHRDDLILAAVAGAVGEGQAVPFATWMREVDLPDPDAVLADPTSWTPDPKRPDRDFAILGAVAQRAVSLRDPQKWIAAWRVLAQGLSAGKDLVVPAAQVLCSWVPPDGFKRPEVCEVARELAPVLRAAGYRV